jgi:hypothetical protein
MELTEILSSIKPKFIAFAIKSLEEKLKERVKKQIPRNLIIEVTSYEEESPSVGEQNMARLACIKEARKLEGNGVLKSIYIPPYRE